jgi:hypothetical protein
MPMFHLHIGAGSEVVRYGSGTDYPNLAHVRAVATELARELVAGAVRSGSDVGTDAFAISDDEGKELAVVPFTGS